MRHEITQNRTRIYTKALLISCVFVFLFVWFSVTSLAEAAELKLSSPISELGVSQHFQVDLMVDTGGESVNAFFGKIVFPGDLLKIKDVIDSNSIINFWIERPSVRVVSCSVSCEFVFSGITPGGYLGNQGLILSAVFQTKKEGRGMVEIRDAKVLLNDGKGTSANLSISSFSRSTGSRPAGQFSISEEVPPALPMVEAAKDTDPPEDFKPEIAQNPEMFEGKYFLVFATQDKDSGIDYYSIHESTQKRTRIDTKKWIEAKSPYQLKDQKLRSFVYVKAVDKSGNERIAVVEPRYPMRWYELPLVWIIIILVIIFTCIFIKRNLWRKHTK